MNFCVDSLLWTKHGSISEMKEQSKQWTSPDESFEESEDRKVGRKGDGNHSSVEANDQW